MAEAGLRELEAVLAVSRLGSFRSAALSLGMSPTALSHAVAALEARLGIRLFHRTTRSVALSEAGSRFVARVGPALGAIADAIAEAAEAQAMPAGTLRINASTAALRFVVPAIAGFLDAHPAMRLDLVAEDRLVDIVADGFDAGIRLAEMVPQDMVAVACSADIGFAVVGAASYLVAHGEPGAPAELVGHRCIRRRLANGRLYSWEFERNGEAMMVAVDGPFTADNEAAMADAARAGLGLAYLRSWTVEDDLASGRLVQVLAEWTPPHPGFRLYYPGHRHVSAGLRALSGFLRARPSGVRRAARSPPASAPP